jgi:hypothetical protein
MHALLGSCRHVLLSIQMRRFSTPRLAKKRGFDFAEYPAVAAWIEHGQKIVGHMLVPRLVEGPMLMVGIEVKAW